MRKLRLGRYNDAGLARFPPVNVGSRVVDLITSRIANWKIRFQRIPLFVEA